jgi:hypothetical protein
MATPAEDIATAMAAILASYAANPNRPVSYSINGQSVTRINPLDAIKDLQALQSTLNGPTEISSIVI